ncbi:hypothetical protein BGW36DRAFT_428737 [Talaromyces proteolyticus]|uniref:ABM domain-containing protein n=1 Tax=Talaromyces proteolyticus TaxID=1131652 RepID=A0AAD4KUD3_9EURO|nr:uncharacterized protein BGW36DRAFT_428737 [Talaromyces proteolyticus]KAH8696746.1 hypothetical protein BGW36DRAFT_428737 [Talaromyces proteolyticus]
MSTEPIHVVASFIPKPGKLSEFFEAVKPVVQHLEKEIPGVHHVYCFQTKTHDNKDQITFIEKFANAQTLQTHHDSRLFLDMIAKLEDLIEFSDVKSGSLVLGFENRC